MTKIKQTASKVALAYCVVYAAKGWYYLGREMKLALNEARARRNR